MAKALSAAQRRAVTGSDPATGRLSARADVCAALVSAGLAVPHGRGGHHSHYLTPEGLRQRAALAAADAAREATREVPAASAAPTVPAAPGGAFTADDGTGTAPPGGPRRTAEVAAAWEGLLGIRAVLLDGVTDVPAPWERERLVHAVALALEAAGRPPFGPDSSAGYTVARSVQDGAVEVTWQGAPAPADAVRELDACAALLDARGWQCTRHRERGGRPFLLASPRRRH